MPFKSKKQKTYLAINEPDVYKKFKKEETMTKRKNAGKIIVKNKDGTVNKKETARVKYNNEWLKSEIKRDMFGRAKKNQTGLKDLALKGFRKVMSVVPGTIGKEGKRQMQIKRIADKVAKYERATKKNMGGKVYKVNNSGQQLVAKQYGGKVK